MACIYAHMSAMMCHHAKQGLSLEANPLEVFNLQTHPAEIYPDVFSYGTDDSSDDDDGDAYDEAYDAHGDDGGVDADDDADVDGDEDYDDTTHIK